MTVNDLWDELGAALDTIRDYIDGIQVAAMMNGNPTPPSLDVYPGDPFMTGAGFGVEQVQVFFTIRARVSTADSQAGQRLIGRLLDPTDSASVEAAIDDVATVVPDGVSGFRQYLEDVPTNGRLLGCEWRVTAFL